MGIIPSQIPGRIKTNEKEFTINHHTFIVSS